MWNVVLDGTDNFESRFEINKACVECHKPLISAAVIRFEGQISVFKGYKVDQPCYQCLYSEEGGSRESCVENGVFSTRSRTCWNHPSAASDQSITRSR